MRDGERDGHEMGGESRIRRHRKENYTRGPEGRRGTDSRAEKHEMPRKRRG